MRVEHIPALPFVGRPTIDHVQAIHAHLLNLRIYCVRIRDKKTGATVASTRSGRSLVMRMEYRWPSCEPRRGLNRFALLVVPTTPRTKRRPWWKCTGSSEPPASTRMDRPPTSPAASETATKKSRLNTLLNIFFTAQCARVVVGSGLWGVGCVCVCLGVAGFGRSIAHADLGMMAVAKVNP
jgi:hypothetical protein